MEITVVKENNIEIGDIDQLIILMLIFHDYGKLNDEWQTPIRAYQREKSMHNDRYNFNPNEILAHTDFDRNNKEDLELAKRFKLNNKPPHAGIGGIVIKEFLINNYELPEQVPDILCNAITKHHSVETEKYKDFNIKENDSDILKLLEEYSIHKFNFIKTRKRKGIIDNNIINDYEYLLYFFFVRILRIADQKATENYQKYIL